MEFLSCSGWKNPLELSPNIPRCAQAIPRDTSPGTGNPSRDWESSPALGSSFQCLTALSRQELFPISHLPLSWPSWRPFPLPPGPSSLGIGDPPPPENSCQGIVERAGTVPGWPRILRDGSGWKIPPEFRSPTSPGQPCPVCPRATSPGVGNPCRDWESSPALGSSFQCLTALSRWELFQVLSQLFQPLCPRPGALQGQDLALGAPQSMGLGGDMTGDWEGIPGWAGIPREAVAAPGSLQCPRPGWIPWDSGRCPQTWNGMIHKVPSCPPTPNPKIPGHSTPLQALPRCQHGRLLGSGMTTTMDPEPPPTFPALGGPFPALWLRPGMPGSRGWRSHPTRFGTGALECTGIGGIPSREASEIQGILHTRMGNVVHPDPAPAWGAGNAGMHTQRM
ncbi:uncharacterized protein LOC126646665 isoform X2 [Myiozetetes cayanensis]|uniref:uncharacterized protein LOC126646665 isoform X2 n=1 Tax=Myiozetetes cayanensis TaxID=478635 RepID=UPI00215F160D|nr:uncharacterized protein LOC126646665 isoform X2 [Myiozetetes cayanensis]